MDSSKPYDKPLFKAVKILLAIAAYGYLAYKLISYKDYSSLFSTWDSLDMERIGWLISAIALFPLNLFLEAGKWRFLLQDIHPITYTEAQRQVYCGLVGAFITPYRVGDYPARAMFLEDKTLFGKATVLGFVGGAAQTIVIILFGIFPSIYYLNNNLNIIWALLGFVICLGVILLAPRLIKQHFSFTQFLGAMGWSALRCFVFSLQLYAILLFVGAPITLSEALCSIPLYYLFIYRLGVIMALYWAQAKSLLQKNLWSIALHYPALDYVSCSYHLYRQYSPTHLDWVIPVISTSYRVARSKRWISVSVRFLL